MHKFKILFTLLLFCFTVVEAQNFKPVKDTLSFKQKLEKMSKEIKTLESDFIQIKNLSMLSEKITSKGHFYYGGPSLLRWEYFEPYKYIILINKEKVFIKDEKKTQKYDMNSNKVFKEINDIMVACVNGDILKSKKFIIKYQENEKYYKLELSPTLNTMKQSLKRIDMYFDKNVSGVVKLDMIEPTNDNTIIEFNNKKQNQPIPPEKFILK